MSDEINYSNNPLHGVGLKTLVSELVEHYGFDILFAYLNINCFRTNPSVASSVKFLKKTDWAREKVEVFYLYQFKSLPKPSSAQFKLPPRERIIPDGQTPGEPAELSLENAAQLHEKKRDKAAAWQKDAGYRGRKKTTAKRSKPSSFKDDSNRSKTSETGESKPQARDSKPQKTQSGFNPWANWDKK